jgi:hypothetical protein
MKELRVERLRKRVPGFGSQKKKDSSEEAVLFREE